MNSEMKEASSRKYFTAVGVRNHVMILLRIMALLGSWRGLAADLLHATISHILEARLGILLIAAWKRRRVIILRETLARSELM